jgi:hypothetical protein
LEVEMIKIMFVTYTLLIIIAVVVGCIGVRYYKNDEYNIKGIKYVLWGTSVTGICVILIATLI